MSNCGAAFSAKYNTHSMAIIDPLHQKEERSLRSALGINTHV